MVAGDAHLVGPFTEVEVYEAHRLIMSEEKARDFVDRLREHVRTTAGTPVWTDDSLLLFAVLSDGAAARVVEQAPDLEAVVRRIRAEPENWREIWEAHVQGL